MGTLQKFLHGASTAGATLFADQAMTEHKSRLTAARDATLQKNKAAGQQIGIEASAEEGRLDRASREKIAKERLRGEREGKLTAKQKDVNSWVRVGLFKTEKEAWASIERDTKGLLQLMLKMIVERQKESYAQPGEEGYLSPAEMLAEARSLVAAKPEAPATVEAIVVPPVGEEDTTTSILDQFSNYLFGGEDVTDPAQLSPSARKAVKRRAKLPPRSEPTAEELAKLSPRSKRARAERTTPEPVAEEPQYATAEEIGEAYAAGKITTRAEAKRLLAELRERNARFAT